MPELNLAQKILIKLGIPDTIVTLGHYKGLSRSHTKKGPGRYHGQGKLNENKETA